MSNIDYVCPLCGEPTIKNEMFCRSCQKTAKKANLDKFLKGATSSKKEKPSIPEAIPTEIKQTSHSFSKDTPLLPIEKSYKYTLLKILIVISIGAVGFTTYYYVESENFKAEKKYWTQCIDENTSLGYADYLEKYPKGKFSISAEERIRELKNLELIAWNDLKSSNDIDAYTSYLEEYPNTPHAKNIKNKIDRLAWQKALKENNADSYKAYLDNIELKNYQGEFKELAQDRYNYQSQLQILEGEEYNSVFKKTELILKALAKNDIEKLKTYISSMPIQFFNTKGLDKSALIDSIKVLYEKRHEETEKNSLDIIKEQTSIIKDIDNIYLVNTSVIEKIILKNKKVQLDTLQLAIQLDKGSLLQKVVIIKGRQ